jgi:hypothetical protein
LDILQPAMQGKSFILYLATWTHALVPLLAQQDENNKEHLVYYNSQTLIDYEKRYMLIEKQCLALVFTITQLRHYLLNAEV